MREPLFEKAGLEKSHIYVIVEAQLDVTDVIKTYVRMCIRVMSLVKLQGYWGIMDEGEI